MSNSVKSVVVRQPGGPENLELVELEIPRPGPHDVVIRTRSMGVSRPDILIRKGVYSWMPLLPASPGNELTGIIEQIGSEVHSRRIGQAVLLSARDLPIRGGCYAEAVCVPAEATYILPPGSDFDSAVVLPTYLVAYAMLNDLGFRKDAKSIFISGVAGSVGGALAELAKARGLTVIGSVGSDEKAERARLLGVDHITNYKQENVVRRTLEVTAGRGVDVVFDHIIGPRFGDLVGMLADFGTLVFFNIHAPMPEEDMFRKLCAMSTKSLALRCFNIHTYDHHPQERRRLMGELIDLFGAGKINPLVGARLPMSQAGEAHRLLEDGAVVGKITLHP